MKIRLAFGVLAITLVGLLDSIECSGRDGYRHFTDEERAFMPPPPHLRRQPEPFPTTWIHYPYPYYYDSNGVIRDYMRPGSEGLILNGSLVGMIRPNGDREYLSRNNVQYIIRLHSGRVLYRTQGEPRLPNIVTPSSNTPSSSHHSGGH